MGHAGGRRGGAAVGSVIGVRYRHTTPEVQAHAVAAIEQRLAVALTAAGPNDARAQDVRGDRRYLWS
jgi:hypothetical protein